MAWRYRDSMLNKAVEISDARESVFKSCSVV
jgi:hypothetical protein